MLSLLVHLYSLKKRIDGEPEQGREHVQLEDDYDETTDDYAEEHPANETKDFAWINGVGIVVGVVGALFGFPIFF